jgi:hypothetical protein
MSVRHAQITSKHQPAAAGTPTYAATAKPNKRD